MALVESGPVAPKISAPAAMHSTLLLNSHPKGTIDHLLFLTDQANLIVSEAVRTLSAIGYFSHANSANLGNTAPVLLSHLRSSYCHSDGTLLNDHNLYLSTLALALGLNIQAKSSNESDESFERDSPLRSWKQRTVLKRASIIRRSTQRF
jgi:hypothetical protein